jgi:hypothetical protein
MWRDGDGVELCDVIVRFVISWSDAVRFDVLFGSLLRSAVQSGVLWIVWKSGI